MSIIQRDTFFFIGVAGAGMSALAQFLALGGKKVLGSDRLFVQEPQHPIIKQLEKAGIKLFPQGQGQIPDDAIVIVSTAIEESVPEMHQAREKNLTIIHRSDLLQAITERFKTIAVSGTAGKSTTTAMIFHILEKNGLSPSLITGAPLISIQSRGYIGNARIGKGDYLVIEADESDGSLVKYHPETGLILNVDIDHKALDELIHIFNTFADNSHTLITNATDTIASQFSRGQQYDFCWEKQCGFSGSNFSMDWQGISFTLNGLPVNIPLLGKHNAMNALAAIAASTCAGVSTQKAIQALETFRGIARRMQIIYRGINFSIIDDYAHNPSKIRASIETAQHLGNQVIAWFQPHGFSPLKLWGNELVKTIASTMRPQDIFVMSRVYYAGGTAPKDVNPQDYIKQMKDQGVNAYYLELRKALPDLIREKARPHTVVLLMGARDPLLDYFANFVSNSVIYFDDLV